MTKNDKKWKEIFERFDIPKVVREQGQFIISANQIQEFGREPRLMTKLDHRSSLPKVFSKHDLAILPISRGTYVIAPIRAYMVIPDAHEEPIPKAFPEQILSLDYSNISSEAAALNCAYLSGMLQDFLQVEDLVPTVSGRMGSGKFSFTVDLSTGGTLLINVNNAQIEIDGGYESSEALVLIEAKNTLPRDFIIRQLYYPYRLWHEKIGAKKRVRSIFMTYSNGIFTFYEYIFHDKQNYNSLSLHQVKRYIITDEIITLDDLKRIYQENVIRAEPAGIPFPQANSFERVINICEILYHNDKISRDEITELYEITPRQTNYYTDAARYLGLVNREKSESGDTIYVLTDAGRRVFAANLKQKNLALAKLILRQQPFRQTFEFFLMHRYLPPEEIVADFLKASNVHRVQSDRTFERRASTVIAWVSWITRLIGD